MVLWWDHGEFAVGKIAVARLERRFEKVRGRHKISPTGWGFLKNHLVCIVAASFKYRNANRERESLRYRENYMIYFKILQFYLNTMRVY